MANIFLKWALLIIAALCFSACESIFFYPSSEKYLDPSEINLRYEDVYFKNKIGNTLHAWFLLAKSPLKGSVLFLHGNAGNISSHISAVYWLPDNGYNVFLLDYSGYGLSEGSPSIEGAITDAKETLNLLAGYPEVRGNKIILFGQSLGGAIALNVAADPEAKEKLCAVIVDSAFSSFRGVARDKLSSLFITLPFKYPLSWLIPSSYDPIKAIKNISPLPLFIIHGAKDETVLLYHSKLLFKEALEPKQFWEEKSSGHIEILTKDCNREVFVDYLNGVSGCR